MNLAILLCGNIRTTKIQVLFDKFNQYLLEPNRNHSIDTFISLWNNTGERTDSPDGVLTVPNVDESEINRIFHPTILKITDYLDYKPLLLDKTQKVYEVRDAQVAAGKLPEGIKANRILANCSMWSRWSDVEKLKNDYKAGKNKDYAVIFRIRADFVFIKPFIIPEVDHILTPPWPDRAWNIESMDVYRDGINDWWVIGPENLVSKMNSLYDNYDTMFGLLSNNLEPFINPHKLPVQNCWYQGFRDIRKMGLPNSDFGYILSRTTEERCL